MKSQLSFLQLKDFKKKLDDQFLLKIVAQLTDIHERFLSKIDDLDEIVKKKVGPKGDKPSTKELLDLLRPFIDERLNDKEIMRILEPFISNLKKYIAPSREEITEMLRPLIFIPQKGIHYFTDEDKEEIAELASRMVDIPENDEKEIDPMKILDAIHKLPVGKRIPGRFIDGLEQTLSALKNQTKRGYLHGGGVTALTAGSNITLVRGNDGNYTISAAIAGANSATESLPGTQVGNNVTLNLANLSHTFVSIQFITRQGQILNNSATDGWSRSGNTATITAASSSDFFQVTYTY